MPESQDSVLRSMLTGMELWTGDHEDFYRPLPGVRRFNIQRPDGEYAFLHETAIMEFHGILFASWYNCPEKELHGKTVIRGRRSYDGGRTWSDVEMLCEDSSGKLLYCPPVYGVSNDTLHMLVNSMIGPDEIHSLDTYRYDEQTGKFVLIGSEAIPFKLNTNACTLANGKLLLAGRTGIIDHTLEIPAVLIADNGSMAGPWRIVRIQKDDTLPDGRKYVFPETSVIAYGAAVFAFTRFYIPIFYASHDNGETWSTPMSLDLPIAASKIYSGTLSNGSSYIIANAHPGRTRLFIAFTRKGESKFCKAGLIENGWNDEAGCGPEWSYPVAHEANGNLYISYTTAKTGAMAAIYPLSEMAKLGL